jgi:hypothetical protein
MNKPKLGDTDGAHEREPRRSDRTSVLCKLIGAGMLLASAITQNFIYDKITNRAEDLYNASRDMGLIDKGGLIHQTDYYVLSARSDAESQAMAATHLRFFALKLYQSQVVSVSVAAGVSPEQKDEYLATVRTLASQVNDAQSALRLTQFINSAGVLFSNKLTEEEGRLPQQRSAARWSFLLLYVLGGLIALYGGYREWRLAQLPTRAIGVQRRKSPGTVRNGPHADPK